MRGKRGVGYCKSMSGALRPFERLRDRPRPTRADHAIKDENGANSTENGSGELRVPGPTDLIFPKWQRELFKTILDEENLRFDREGRPRTAYSLRHTYICLCLMEGADIYQIAKIAAPASRSSRSTTQHTLHLEEKSYRFGPQRVAGAAEVARGERQAQAAGGGSTLSSVFGSNGGCEPNTTLNICDHRLALSPPYHDNHRRLRVQTPTPIIAKRFLYIVASEHEK